jgi:tetratricopeptide (TPR) repeat protein
LDFDESNANAHTILGAVYRRRQQYELAINEYELALKLNPNDAESIYGLGSVLFYDGQRDEAIMLIKTALRFDPRSGPGNFMHLGMAYYLNEQYEDAIKILKKGVNRHPDFSGNYIGLAAAYAQLGQTEDARNALQKVFRLEPFFEIDTFGTAYRNPADREEIVQGLRKAGLE